MKNCPLCGEELTEKMQYCPHCGEPLNREPRRKDLWEEGAQEEEEDWTVEVPEEELLDLEEDSGWVAPTIPEGWVPQAKPEKKGKKLVLPVLGILAGLLLLGLGIRALLPRKLPELPGSGMYQGIRCAGPDLVSNAREDWVELKADGSLRMELLGSPCLGTWTLEGTAFQGQLENGTVLKGTLEQGTLTFSYQGLTFLFALPGREPALPPEDQKLPTLREVPDYGHWAGDYYGLMGIYDGTGQFEDGDGEAFDVCGRILVEGDTGVLALWNGDNKLGERFCMADVLFTEGAGEQGRMMVQWGALYNMELRSGAWVVDPLKSPVSTYEGMLCIQGSYVNPEDPGDSFAYEILLRPWGMRWEDVEDPNLVPPGYDSWYLPLLREGFLMPESF